MLSPERFRKSNWGCHYSKQPLWDPGLCNRLQSRLGQGLDKPEGAAAEGNGARTTGTGPGGGQVDERPRSRRYSQHRLEGNAEPPALGRCGPWMSPREESGWIPGS